MQFIKNPFPPIHFTFTTHLFFQKSAADCIRHKFYSSHLFLSRHFHIYSLACVFTQYKYTSWRWLESSYQALWQEAQSNQYGCNPPSCLASRSLATGPRSSGLLGTKPINCQHRITLQMFTCIGSWRDTNICPTSCSVSVTRIFGVRGRLKFLW